MSCAATAILLAGTGGCGRKEKTDREERGYPLETARMVSHVTSDAVSSSSKIQVKFVAPVIETRLVGIALKKKVFSFEPPIEGTASWIDVRTLQFEPGRPLEPRTSHTGTLDMAALFPEHKDRDLKPLVFTFEVTGREIEFEDGEFELVDEDDPARLIYKGTIRFTEPADLELVRKSVTLRLDGGKLELEWLPGRDEREYLYATPAITRDDRQKSLVLLVDKDDLDLSKDYRHEFVLEPLRDLKVSQILPSGTTEEPGVRIEFSDPLDPAQDITGLVSIENLPDLKLKKSEKTVTLTGAFKLDKVYTVIVHEGIRSTWGTRIEKPITQQVEFEDIKPQIRFSSEGVFLPNANEQKILFMSVNVTRIYCGIMKVFESNLGQFMQTQALTGTMQMGLGFHNYELKRVGVPVQSDTFEIGIHRNEWLQHELDLAKVIPSDFKGLFLVKLSFGRDDMLYQDKGRVRGDRRRNWYYEDPSSQGYIYAHGTVMKPIIASNIGLTYKRAHRRHVIYATGIPDAAPMRGVRVKLRTYQNQVIAQKITGDDGKADFRDIDEEVFYVEAEKDGQRSVVKTNEMSWNLSGFDIDGAEMPPGGTRAFIYTERGVYRPGDEINISLIARNEDNTFPDDHPVTIKILDPRKKLVMEETRKTGRDGFYSFSFRSEPEAPTGNWTAVIHAGSREFTKRLKIETVVPNRLKVVIEPEKTRLERTDSRTRISLSANYLFGNPGAGLEAEVEAELRSVEKTFKRFPGFIFSNRVTEFKPVKNIIFKGRLDDNGKAAIDWSLPSFAHAPSALDARLTAEVLDKGGRPNRNFTSIPIDPYDRYAGIAMPEFDYGYTKVGSPFDMRIVLVDTEGRAVVGLPLRYRIYKNSRHWWWEYRSRREFILQFKTDSSTELAAEGTIFSKTTPVPLTFKPEERGEYLIEVRAGDDNGHTAGRFFRAYYWGEAPRDSRDAGILTLKTDKTKYHPGEEAIVRFPSPHSSSILVTVEKASHILSSQWNSGGGDADETEIRIPITDNMVPTSYVTVSVIQPHSQTANDRPMRMYGVVPLSVEDPGSRQELSIVAPEELRSNEAFEVTIQTADMQPAQLTVAVVDEGLLDLTGFETPDPWKEYYRKLRLGVRTFDLFSQVIGVNKGDIFRTFSVGGDYEMEAYRLSQQDIEKVRRFKPVSMFKGPVMTDSKGRVVVSFTMPDYVGSVRVMAASAMGYRYGSAEKAIPVKTDLMVLPTLPRVLGPTDRIAVPVTVFSMNEGIREVDVSMEATAPLYVRGEASKRITFDEPAEKDVLFELEADEAIGAGTITISAAGGRYKAKSVTDISIRPSSPRIYDTIEETCEPGAGVSLLVPRRGVAGSNHAVLSVMRKPKLNLQKRLRWLMHYPYGCIEQTVSSVFPQLHLREFIKESPGEEAVIDENINAAILRLRQFRLPSGAFSYWPGGGDASIWGTSYAGHFLIEAKRQGYHVPHDLLERWMSFERSRSLTTRDDLFSRVYRVYLLALSGNPHIGPMNLLLENSLKDMQDVEKWLLAGAYKLAGVTSTADRIARQTGFDVRDYNEFSGTYGSGLRDKAVILEMLIPFEMWSEADVLYKDITNHLSAGDWYSTQTTGYALLALGKYIKANAKEFGDEDAVLAGYVRMPSGERVPFETDRLKYSIAIEEGFGQSVEVHIDERTNLSRAYILLEWDGVPLLPDVSGIERNLALDIEWLDEDGMPIDPSSIRQGSTFWGHFYAAKGAGQHLTIEELALVQVLPAGWEIENIRLSGERKPEWMKRWKLHREEYMDIRDDRIMWFFDMQRNVRSLDFVVKLNAVTVGDFILPPAVFEAMYNDNYRAVSTGRRVSVE
jgi:uncharacterized protein YfaS (alpha-2-macroglobulin family)